MIQHVIGRIPWCFCCSIVFVRGTCTSTKRLQGRTEARLDPNPIWSTKLLKRLVPMVYQQLLCEWTTVCSILKQLRFKAKPLCSAVLWRMWERVCERRYSPIWNNEPTDQHSLSVNAAMEFYSPDWELFYEKRRIRKTFKNSINYCRWFVIFTMKWQATKIAFCFCFWIENVQIRT